MDLVVRGAKNLVDHTGVANTVGAEEKLALASAGEIQHQLCKV
jgi:hypothetical protein